MLTLGFFVITMSRCLAYVHVGRLGRSLTGLGAHFPSCRLSTATDDLQDVSTRIEKSGDRVYNPGSTQRPKQKEHLKAKFRQHVNP